MLGSASLIYYGGVYLLHRYFGRLHLTKLLSDEMRLIQRKNRCSVGKMLLAFQYPIILGLDRIESARLLRQNGVFQYLTGLCSYLDATTLRRFLLWVALTTLPKLRHLRNRFRFRLTTRPRPQRWLIVDGDSTGLILYRKQERARIGYNPSKRGRPSYHPLL